MSDCDPYLTQARTCCQVLRMRLLQRDTDFDDRKPLRDALRIIAADLVEHEVMYGLSVLPASPRSEVTREPGDDAVAQSRA